MALATTAPFPQYFDKDGDPLDEGKLYFGQPGQNPLIAPITVYWDAAATIPAAQPVKTINGYTARAGTPALLYTNGDYSLLVKNRRGEQIYFAETSANFSNDASLQAQINAFIASLAASSGASLIGFLQLGTGAVARTVLSKLRDIVNPKDYGATNDGIADDGVKLQAAINYCQDNNIALELTGTYLTSIDLVVTKPFLIIAKNAKIISSKAAGVASSILYYDGTTAAGLIIGAKLMGNLDLEFATRDWTVERNTFKASGCYSCEWHIGTKNGRNNVLFYADFVGGQAKAVTYCQLFMRDSSNAYRSFKADCANAAGWVNQNIIYGGRWYTGVNTTGAFGAIVDPMAATAVHIEITGTPYRNDGNRFISCSLETIEALHKMWVINGDYNTLRDPRCENAAGTAMVEFNGDYNSVTGDASPYFYPEGVTDNGQYNKYLTIKGIEGEDFNPSFTIGTRRGASFLRMNQRALAMNCDRRAAVLNNVVVPEFSNYTMKLQESSVDIAGHGLYTYTLPQLTFSITVVDSLLDTLTIPGHPFTTGMPVLYHQSGGTAVGGLTDKLLYWAIRVDANTVKLASSLANAQAGTAINFTSAGTGSQWLSYQAGQEYGFFRDVAASNITITAGTNSVMRCKNLGGAGFTSVVLTANNTYARIKNLTPGFWDVVAVNPGSAVAAAAPNLNVS